MNKEDKQAKWALQVKPITAKDAEAELQRIFDDLQTRFHDQWDWLDAAFYLEVLMATIRDASTPEAAGRMVEVAGCSRPHWGISDCSECGLRAEFQANSCAASTPEVAGLGDEQWERLADRAAALLYAAKPQPLPIEDQTNWLREKADWLSTYDELNQSSAPPSRDQDKSENRAS